MDGSQGDIPGKYPPSREEEDLSSMYDMDLFWAIWG